MSGSSRSPIGGEVLSVEESPEVGLVIRFGLGEIVTNPAPTGLSGREIAMLKCTKDRFEGWPGT